MLFRSSPQHGNIETWMIYRLEAQTSGVMTPSAEIVLPHILHKTKTSWLSSCSVVLSSVFFSHNLQPFVPSNTSTLSSTHTNHLYPNPQFIKVFSTKAFRMSADMESFSAHLQGSKRILALLGAGLSASSGLPTFRGAGGLWRTHDATTLATPEAFNADPGLVWQFYSYRRHMSLQAQPNKAHMALAELARKNHGFMTLSQNVDGNSRC